MGVSIQPMARAWAGVCGGQGKGRWMEKKGCEVTGSWCQMELEDGTVLFPSAHVWPLGDGLAMHTASHL